MSPHSQLKTNGGEDLSNKVEQLLEKRAIKRKAKNKLTKRDKTFGKQA